MVWHDPTGERLPRGIDNENSISCPVQFSQGFLSVINGCQVLQQVAGESSSKDLVREWNMGNIGNNPIWMAIYGAEVNIEADITLTVCRYPQYMSGSRGTPWSAGDKEWLTTLAGTGTGGFIFPVLVSGFAYPDS